MLPPHLLGVYGEASRAGRRDDLASLNSAARSSARLHTRSHIARGHLGRSFCASRTRGYTRSREAAGRAPEA